MNKWIKRVGIGLGAIVLLQVAAVGTGLHLADRKLHRIVEVDQREIALPADAASLAHGRYLFMSRGCGECHGANGAGRVFAHDDHGLLLKSPNITAGAGSVTKAYKDADWFRTIRHGVKPDGRPVFVMPSEDFARLTDADVGDIVAYAKRLPPTAGEGAQFDLPIVMRALYGMGMIKDAAEKIDHTQVSALETPEDASPIHGKYVAQMCLGCHGPTLSGGKLPGHPPSWPAAANLTPGAGSVLPRYPDVATFKAMLRSGKRPDGTAIDRAMPFASLGALSDLDVEAVYLYLKSLPPVPAGQG